MKLTRVLKYTTGHLALLAILITSATSAHAFPLEGTSVTGTLFINGGVSNLFDPENGKVPDFTYGNSANTPGNGSNIVPISDDLVEFGYLGSMSNPTTITADFTSGGPFTALVMSTTGIIPFSGTMSFSNPAFAGLQLTGLNGAPNCFFAVTTITTLNGGGTPSLTTIECSFSAGAANFTHTYGLVPAATPEPASLMLLGLGLASVIVCRRKRQ